MARTVASHAGHESGEEVGAGEAGGGGSPSGRGSVLAAAGPSPTRTACGGAQTRAPPAAAAREAPGIRRPEPSGRGSAWPRWDRDEKRRGHDQDERGSRSAAAGPRPRCEATAIRSGEIAFGTRRDRDDERRGRPAHQRSTATRAHAARSLRRGRASDVDLDGDCAGRADCVAGRAEQSEPPLRVIVPAW